MKLFVLIAAISSQVNAICEFSKITSRDECQRKCDQESKCGVWVYDRKLSKCYLKDRLGWCANASADGDAGFKNQGPFFLPNTDFNGGNFNC